MRLITIKVREDDERNIIEAKMECDPNDNATTLEAFTADRIMQAVGFMLNSSTFMPPTIATGFGPDCDKQTEVQLDILKAGGRHNVV